MAGGKKVLVIGGGIGGLSAAIAARRVGADVDLVELRSEWKVYHVGIIVQGNFIRAMEQLGIVDDAIELGYPQNGIVFQTLHGQVLMDIPGVRLASPRYPSDLGLTRPALHEVLTRNARQLDVRVRLGTTFAEIDAARERPTVTFTDGTRGEYDLVVAADGVHSQVRAAVFGADYRPRFTGQGVWRYNVPRPKHITRTFMCLGLKGGKCGFVPLNEDTGYVILVQAEPGNPKHPADRLADIFRERLAPCTGEMAALRDQITDSSLVVYRPLEAILMPRPWHKGGVLLIGDAAHATTPHMGQGAAQAVEDAVVVGELLGRGLAGDALGAAFMARRYERLKFIWEASLQIGDWEQHDDPNQDPGGLTKKMLDVVARPI